MALSRVQGGIVVCAFAAGAALAWGTPSCAANRVVSAGFWLEPVRLESPPIGELTPHDVDTIAGVARSELTAAFAGLRIAISDRRDATYRVRVVQQLRDLRFRRYVAVAGEARSVAGFGGSAAVNFEMLANHAMGYAPPDADREAVVSAIGRGIGRAAVHELTHLLLPTAPIHKSEDVASYEYHTAARIEQYYGDMRWNLAWPLLTERIGSPSRSID